MVIFVVINTDKLYRWLLRCWNVAASIEAGAEWQHQAQPEGSGQEQGWQEVAIDGLLAC